MERTINERDKSLFALRLNYSDFALKHSIGYPNVHVQIKSMTQRTYAKVNFWAIIDPKMCF